MFANGPILIEVVVVLGGALAWGLWELRSLSKRRQEMEGEEREAAARKAADAQREPPA